MLALINTKNSWAQLQGIQGPVAVRIWSNDSHVVGIAGAFCGGRSLSSFYIPLAHRFGDNLQVSAEEVLHWFESHRPLFFNYAAEAKSLNLALDSTLAFGGDLSRFPRIYEEETFERVVRRHLGVSFQSLQTVLGEEDPANLVPQEEAFQDTVSREASLLHTLFEEVVDRCQDPDKKSSYRDNLSLAQAMVPLAYQGLEVKEDLLNESLEGLVGRLDDVLVKTEKYLGPKSSWSSWNSLAKRLFHDEDGLKLTPQVMTPKTNVPSVSADALRVIETQSPAVSLLLQGRDIEAQVRSLTGVRDSIAGGRVRMEWTDRWLHPLAAPKRFEWFDSSLSVLPGSWVQVRGERSPDPAVVGWEQHSEASFALRSKIMSQSRPLWGQAKLLFPYRDWVAFQLPPETLRKEFPPPFEVRDPGLLRVSF